MRKSIFLLTVLLLAVSLLLPCFAEAQAATPYDITVHDNADLLDASEEAALAEQAGGNRHGVQFFVVTSRTQLSSSRVLSLCGITSEQDAVVLVIERSGSTYYYEMFTFNRADSLISNSDADDILDNAAVYDNIKGGNPAQGALAFFDGCQSAIDRSVAAEAAKESRKSLTAVLTGLSVGVLVGGLTVLGVFLYYRKKRHGESYPLDRYAQMALTDSRDTFVGSFVTRVRVQSNSGGGGRGGHASGGSRGRR